MKLTRLDWVSALAIAAGTTVGVGVTAMLLERAEHSHDHVTEHVVQQVLVGPAAEVEVHSGTQAEIRLRATAPTLEDLEQPFIYVDGVRVQDMAAVESLDPDRIERIEVIKRGAALEQFGEAAATRGVIQIFLKPSAGGSGGN